MLHAQKHELHTMQFVNMTTNSNFMEINGQKQSAYKCHTPTHSYDLYIIVLIYYDLLTSKIDRNLKKFLPEFFLNISKLCRDRWNFDCIIRNDKTRHLMMAATIQYDID